MGDKNEIVAITTIRQGDPKNSIEKIRSEIFLETATNLKNSHITCIAIYKDCDAEYITKLRNRKIILIEQKSKGMGNARRESLLSGLEMFPRTLYFLWLEPEKPDMPRFAKDMIKKMKKDNSVFGMFNRIGYDSYPREQAYYYLFCRAVASHLLKRDVDYAFGPMMLTRKCSNYFLNYHSEYGDLWDSILVPRLNIIKNEIITVLPINFANNYRMTQIESGNETIILKRIKQLNNVAISLVKEFEKLNLK